MFIFLINFLVFRREKPMMRRATGLSAATAVSRKRVVDTEISLRALPRKQGIRCIRSGKGRNARTLR
jgi:hypothetical protein